VVKLTPCPEGVLVGVRVAPGARSTRMLAPYGERLKIQVSAPPEDNRANECLISALAEWLEVPTAFVSIRSGYRSRDKVVAFKGLDESTLSGRLQRLTDAAEG
jgi:uncharacterized protein